MTDDGKFGSQQADSATSEFNAQAFMFARFMSRVQTVALVRVVAVENAGEAAPVGLVNVQPVINQMTGDRQAVPHGIIYGIPYMRMQGGANAIIIDPKVGDIGVCAFCSRDISIIKAASQADRNDITKTFNPGSFRNFDWADGLYFGGFLNGTPTQYVSFSATGIKLVSPIKISLSAPEIDLVAPVVAITSAAVAIVGASLTHNGVNIGSSHVHGGVVVGGGNTTGPH